MTIGNQNNTRNNEISFKDLILKINRGIQYLFSKWLIILIMVVLGGLGGFTYAYFKKPIYIASTNFVLESGDGSSAGLGQYAGLASMVGIDLGGSGGGGIFQGDNILELYKSRKMIQSALLTETIFHGKKQLLIERYIDFNKLRNSWDKNPILKGIKFTRSYPLTRVQDSLLGTIVLEINRDYLNVSKPDKKLSIINAQVRSNDEFFSKVFNDQIVKNVNDFYVQTKTKKSSRNIQILQQKTDSVRAVMNGAIYSAAAVVDETPNLNPSRQAQRTAPVQRSQFTAETNKAVLGELVKNLELSKMALLKETPLIQVIDQPIYPLEKITTGKIKGALVGAFLMGFLAVFCLLLRKLLNEILS